MPTKEKLTELLIGIVCALITIIINCIPVAAQAAAAGSGSGAGLTSGMIAVTAGQTARLGVRNTGDKGIAVSLQFQDKDGKVLTQKDGSIEPGDLETLEFTGPNNPLGVAGEKAVAIPKGVGGEFSVKGTVQLRLPTPPMIVDVPLSFLQPELRIVDQASGKTIGLIGPEGFAKAKRPEIPVGGSFENHKIALPLLTASDNQKFDSELSKLESFSERLKPALAEAQRKTGIDAERVLAEFRAISEEKDRAKREQTAEQFQARYHAPFVNLVQAAGIDLTAQKRDLMQVLDLSGGKNIESQTMTFDVEDDKPRPSQPSPSPPDTQELWFIAPNFDNAETLGNDQTQAAPDGNMSLHNVMVIAGSAQHLASVTKTLSIEPGVSRIRVYADIGGQYFMQVIGLLGYGSTEAIVNLRVMEGGHVLASDRFSIRRLIAAGVGLQTVNSGRGVTLFAEFARPHPEDRSTYEIVAEIEGWAGAGGFGGARVEMLFSLTRLHVFLHRS